MIWVQRIVAVLVVALAAAWTAAPVLVPAKVSFALAAPVTGLGDKDLAALEAPFTDLLARRDDALRARYVDGADLSGSAEMFKTMRGYVPKGMPVSGRTLASWDLIDSGATLRSLHRLEYPNTYLDMGTRLTRPSADAPWRLDGIHIWSISRADAAKNMALFEGRPLHLQLAFVAAFVSIAVSAGTAAAALLMPGVAWRWLWFGVSLVGLCTLTVFGDGHWWARLAMMQPFGGRIYWPGPFNPWAVQIALPLGALLFWTTRRRPMATAEAPLTPALA